MLVQLKVRKGKAIQKVAVEHREILNLMNYIVPLMERSLQLRNEKPMHFCVKLTNVWVYVRFSQAGKLKFLM